MDKNTILPFFALSPPADRDVNVHAKFSGGAQQSQRLGGQAPGPDLRLRPPRARPRDRGALPNPRRPGHPAGRVERRRPGRSRQARLGRQEHRQHDPGRAGQRHVRRPGQSRHCLQGDNRSDLSERARRGLDERVDIII